MSLKIYIETTIPSFYFETRRNVECISRRNWTRRWWDEQRHEHELATSLVVRDELSDRKSGMDHFTLTSVGMAIAHANLRRKTNASFDLGIWIN
jgi:hypothetical protein